MNKNSTTLVQGPVIPHPKKPYNECGQIKAIVHARREGTTGPSSALVTKNPNTCCRGGQKPPSKKQTN